MIEIIKTMTNADYHAHKEVSSSVLKAALKSPAHLARCLAGKGTKSDAMTLGTAVHAWYLERERFKAEYTEETERYQRAYGVHKAGDPKTDEDGEPLTKLMCPDGAEIKGENWKKFKAMTEALGSSKESSALLDGGQVEVSFIGDGERVRTDLITSDGWIVDLKTVGGSSDLPLTPENFAREFWNNGYDVQMYMYDKLVRAAGLDIKGFIFLCVDAKIPSGVRLFVFERSSDWWGYGEQRYKRAWEVLRKYRETGEAVKYPEATVYDLPVPFAAVGELGNG